MARQNYTDIDDFYEKARERHPGSPITKNDAIDNDGPARNEIAGMMQWFRDNGCDINDDFFNKVTGLSEEFTFLGISKDFGNYSNTKFGGTEMACIGLMMQDVVGMMTDGRITADQAKTYMQALTNPEMLESMSDRDSNESFMQLAYSMSKYLDAEPNPQVAQENMEVMSEPRRAVINDGYDYLDAYAARNPENPDPYNVATQTYASTAIDDMKEMIDAQVEAGAMDEKEAFNITDRLTELQDKHNVGNLPMAVAATAMREAIESGDQELIDKVMSNEFIDGVLSESDDCLAILDDVNKTASGVGVGDKQAESEEKQTEEAEPEDKETTTPADTSARIDGTMVIGMFKGEEGYADPDAVIDDMTAGYFEDKDNIPFDQYVNMENDYEALSERAQEAYLEKHPEFKEASEFMDGTLDLCDKLEEMVTDGKTSDEIGQYLAESGYRDEFTESAKNVVDGIGRENPYDVYEREEAEKEAATPADAEQPETAQESHGDETHDYERIKGAASGIWRGDYGSGDARDEAMQEAGYTADEIALAQSVVNQGYGFTYSMDETAFNEVVEAYGELKQSPDYEEGDKLKCGVVNGETYHAEKQAERAASQEAQQTQQEEEDASDGATLSGSVSDEAQAEQEQLETETASAEKLQYVTDAPESRAEAKPDEDYDFSV